MMRIRTAARQDSDVIHQIHLSAFPESENARVARLAADLLTETTAPPVLSLLAEMDALVVGHAAFSPVAIDTDPGFQGSILAPLVVLPSHQRQGIGAQLVARGLRQLTAAGIQIVFVYGDPNYYGRFGFATEIAQPYIPPYPLQYPSGWQALALAPYPGRKETMQLRCVASLHHPELW